MNKIIALALAGGLTIGCGSLPGSISSDADPGQCRPMKSSCGVFKGGCNNVDGITYTCEDLPDGCGGTSKRCVALRPFPDNPNPPWAPNPPPEPPQRPGDPGPAQPPVQYQQIQ